MPEISLVWVAAVLAVVLTTVGMRADGAMARIAPVDTPAASVNVIQTPAVPVAHVP